MASHFVSTSLAFFMSQFLYLRRSGFVVIVPAYPSSPSVKPVAAGSPIESPVNHRPMSEDKSIALTTRFLSSESTIAT